MGRIEEGIAELKRALELDPLSPIINHTLAGAYRDAHRYDEAIAQYQKALEIDPGFYFSNRNMARVYFLKGMYAEGIEAVRKMSLSRGAPQEKVDKDAAELKEAYRGSGERGYWQLRLEMSEKDARARNREVEPFDIAYYQLGIGNKEGALSTLEKAFATDKRYAAFIFKSNPIWDPLRAEPRFKELLRKVGLPE